LESLGIDLLDELPDKPLIIYADPDRIEQILIILLDNAMKHTPAGGEIHVAGYPMEVTHSGFIFPKSMPHLATSSFPTHSIGKWAIVSISDTGEGIPPEDLPQIFERFYRVDHSRSRDRGGSGLGLSIAKALVEAYDGHIWLTSPSWISKPNQELPGTSAIFSLPIPKN
jgi:signal transduction histidine kinase